MGFWESLGYLISFVVVFGMGLVVSYALIKFGVFTLAASVTFTVLQIATPFALSPFSLKETASFVYSIQLTIYILLLMVALIMDTKSSKQRSKQIDEDLGHINNKQ